MSIVDIREGGVISGAESLARVISVSIGPNGKNVLLDKGFGVITMSNDGYEIAKVINPTDIHERKGVEILREAARSNHESVGDGNKTAVILAYKIIEEGIKNIQAGANPVHIKNGLEKALQVCVDFIESNARTVLEPKNLVAVAKTAVNDEEAASVIGKIFAELRGGDVVNIEESDKMKTSVYRTNGMVIDSGYISPYFAKDKDSLEIKMENVYVLLTEKVISDFEDIIPIIEMVNERASSLLILSAGVTGEALSNLLLNVYKKGLKVVAVSAGGYGIAGSDVLKDAAVYTGGKVIESAIWDIAKHDFSYLGMAECVKVNSNSTVIMGGNGNQTDIDAQFSELNRLCNECEDKVKKISLKKRMSLLSEERIMVRVGAVTQTEMLEKKKKYEKALAACYSACNSGIVSGGGTTYLRSIGRVKAYAKKLVDDERTGAMILATALEAPTFHIARNSGYSGEKIVADIINMEQERGFDVEKGVYCDMTESGIIDSSGVLIEALRNAVSVASVFLTSTVLVNKKD